MRASSLDALPTSLRLLRMLALPAPGGRNRRDRDRARRCFETMFQLDIVHAQPRHALVNGIPSTPFDNKANDYAGDMRAESV